VVNGKKNMVENGKKKKFEGIKESIHFRVQCDGCGKHPIIGDRYKCNDCENFDFCKECYEKLKINHPPEHSFNLIEKPVHRRHCHNNTQSNEVKKEEEIKIKKEEEDVVEEIIFRRES